MKRENLKLIGWQQNGKSIEAPVGYQEEYYWREGKFLGPDKDGIGPVYEKKNPAASAFGRLGGSVKSAAKTAAARENAKKGGWPKGRKRKAD